MRTCNVCHERKATVPDRSVMGRPIKRLCSLCHRIRLSGDAKEILDDYDRRRKANDHTTH